MCCIQLSCCMVVFISIRKQFKKRIKTDTIRRLIIHLKKSEKDKVTRIMYLYRPPEHTEIHPSKLVKIDKLLTFLTNIII